MTGREVPHLEPGIYNLVASNDGVEWTIIETGIVVVGGVDQSYRFPDRGEYRYWRFQQTEPE